MIRAHIKVPQIAVIIYKHKEKCLHMVVQIANFQKLDNQILTSINSPIEV